jgi:hypothetical protein
VYSTNGQQNGADGQQCSPELGTGVGGEAAEALGFDLDHVAVRRHAYDVPIEGDRPVEV